MIRNMNVIRETLKKLLFFIILTLGTTAAWGQTDYSGVYYIANDNSGGAGSGSTETTAYSSATDAIRWFLVPADNPQRPDKRDAYYSPNHASSEGDPGKPFLTTYQTNKDAAAIPSGVTERAHNSVWIVKKTSDGYYNVIHAVTGKYVIYEVPLPNDPNKNTDSDETKNGKRKTMHLQIPDNETYSLSTNTNFKFEITRSGSNNNYIYLLRPINRSGWYMNPANGNRNSYSGIKVKDEVYQAGLVGVYNKSDDGGSKWRFVSTLLDAPTITCTAGVVTVADNNSLPAGYKIRYTVDGTTPNATSEELPIGGYTVIDPCTFKAVIERYGLVLTSVASESVEPLVRRPVFTPNADGTVSFSVPDGITVYYTTDGIDPTTSSTAYTSAISANDIANATGSAIKAIAVDNADNTKVSAIATLALATYTYKIVNTSNAVAINSIPIKQVVGKPLTRGYADIPEEIRSPYISDETIGFYSDIAHNAEHKITATPSATTCLPNCPLQR